MLVVTRQLSTMNAQPHGGCRPRALATAFAPIQVIFLTSLSSLSGATIPAASCAATSLLNASLE